MTVDRDDKRLRFMPIDIAVKPPPGLIEHLKDRYWAFDKERGLIFWKSIGRHGLHPQCNSTQPVADRLIKKLYPWAEVLFVKSVFTRINPHDY